MTTANRLKILIITAWYPNKKNPTEGIFIKPYSRAVQKRNDVRLLYPYDLITDAQEIDDGITLVRIKYKKQTLPGFTYIANIFKIKKAIDKMIDHGWKPDIIHAHVWLAAFDAAILKLFFKIPVVYTEHSSNITQGKLNLIDKIKLFVALKNARYLLPVSQYMEKALKKCARFRDSTVIPIPLEPPNFHIHTKPKSSNKCRIIAITSLRSIKGVDILLQAIALVAKKRRDFLLTIVGQGPQEKEYKTMASELGIDNLVEFTGSIPHDSVIDALYSSNFFVSLSRSETYGVACLEALSCGLPVVATDIPAFRDKINKSNGILVPPGNYKKSAAAIETMIKTLDTYDPQRVSKNILECFGQESIADTLSNIYGQILK